MSKTIILIPSRLDASRLPNKPLLKINNKSLINHVYEKGLSTNIGEVYVATGDREVFEEVGIKVKNIKYFNSQPWPFPASLMLGFFAEAVNKEMTIDYDEIEDAHWFSIDELKSLKHPLISGGFKLPRVDSIARRLVDTWINRFN